MYYIVLALQYKAQRQQTRNKLAASQAYAAFIRVQHLKPSRLLCHTDTVPAQSFCAEISLYSFQVISLVGVAILRSRTCMNADFYERKK